MRAERKKNFHKKPIFDINYIHIHTYIYIYIYLCVYNEIINKTIRDNDCKIGCGT